MAAEAVHDRVGQEAAPRCIDVAIAVAVLLGHEHAKRLDQVQVIAGAGHCHGHEAALLLDLIHLRIRTGPRIEVQRWRAVRLCK